MKKKKNLLILTHHFWPEYFLINDITKELLKYYDIKVVTTHPNYPLGKVFHGYENKKVFIEKFYKDIEVLRIPTFQRKKSNFLNIFFNYISFNLSFLIYSFTILKFIKKTDFIFFFGTSPLTSAIPGIFLKKIYSSKLILWLQDLWPEAIISTGYMKSKFIIKIINRIMSFIYNQSDLILCQSNFFVRTIKKRTKIKNVKYFPNIINSKKNRIINIPIFLEDTLKKNFCIVYTGNIGKVQNLELLIKVSKKFISYPKIKFVIIGQGSNLELIKKLKNMLNAKNVILIPQLENNQMQSIYSLSNALYLSFNGDYWMNNCIIPGKLQPYLKSGKPILASIGGETARLIKKYECGFVSKPNRLNDLYKNILKLYSLNKAEIKKISMNSVKCYEENFDLKKNISLLHDHIEFS